MSQAPSAELTAILKTAGYSVTRPRRMLFELLHGQEPQSMHQLARRAAGQMDRASVYRCVELFEQLGIVRRIYIGWKYTIELSDLFADHHHHLTCIRCQAVTPINETDLEHFVELIAAKYRFQPTDHQIEIQGYCHNCRAGQADTAG